MKPRPFNRELENAKQDVIDALNNNKAFLWYDEGKQQIMVCVNEVGSEDDIPLYGD